MMSRAVEDVIFLIGLFACYLFFVCFSLYVSKDGTNDSVTSANSLLTPTQLVEMVHQRLSAYPVDFLQAAGHQLDKLILSCTYDTDECL